MIAAPSPSVTAPPRSKSVLDSLRAIRSGLLLLGFDALTLAANEARDRIVLDHPLPADKVAALSVEGLRALAAECGPALILRFSLVSDVAVTPVLDEKKLGQLQNDARDLAGLETKVSLILRKRLLLERLGLRGHHAAVHLFFFHEALIRLCGISLQDLEGNGQLFEPKTGKRKRVILVLDGDVLLDGPYLGVAGGSFLADWRSLLPVEAPDAGRTADFHRRAVEARSTLSWVGFSLQSLTPLHLHVHDCGAGRTDQRIARAFFRIRLALALTYTANQTKRIVQKHQHGKEIRETEDWLFTFCSERHLGEVRIDPSPRPMGAAAFGMSVERLAGLAEWAYDREDRGLDLPATGFAPDRLRVLRGAVAQTLHGASPEEGYRRLLENPDRLAGDVERSWQTFVEGKMDEYFAGVRQLEAVVDSTVDSFKGQIQALTKGLTDNMLAAVVFVVGSVIASMFGGPFEPSVFRVGVLLYAFYLAIFPGAIGLTAARQQIESTEKLFNDRVKSFRERLCAKAVEDAVQGVPGLVRQCRSWLTAVKVIFGLTVALLLLATFLAERV
jgi:hypothetical protein